MTLNSTLPSTLRAKTCEVNLTLQGHFFGGRVVFEEVKQAQSYMNGVEMCFQFSCQSRFSRVYLICESFRDKESKEMLATSYLIYKRVSSSWDVSDKSGAVLFSLCSHKMLLFICLKVIFKTFLFLGCQSRFVNSLWATDARPRNDTFDDSNIYFQGPRKVTQQGLRKWLIFIENKFMFLGSWVFWASGTFSHSQRTEPGIFRHFQAKSGTFRQNQGHDFEWSAMISYDYAWSVWGSRTKKSKHRPQDISGKTSVLSRFLVTFPWSRKVIFESLAVNIIVLGLVGL